jgi:hypothetical protein
MRRRPTPITQSLARMTLAIALAGSCLAVHAQMGGGMRRGGGAGGDSMRRDTERKDDGPTLPDRLYELRMRLLIEPAQSPAWERFHADALAIAKPQPRAVSVAEESSAIQSMQRELTLAQNRFTLTENLATSLKALYAQLQPQQQQVADQLVPRLLPFLVQPGGGGGPRGSAPGNAPRP